VQESCAQVPTLPSCRHEGRVVGLGNNLGVFVLVRLLTRAPAISAVRTILTPGGTGDAAGRRAGADVAQPLSRQ